MSHARFFLLGLILTALVGCGKGNKDAAQQQAPAGTQQTQVQPALQPAPPVTENAPQVPEQEPPQATPAPREASRPAPQAKAVNAPSREKGVPPAAGTPVERLPQPSHEAAAPASRGVEPVAAKPPAPKLVTIPSGTSLNVRLQEALDSGVNKSGDTFRVLLDQDLLVGGAVIAPKGTIVEGKVSHVERSGRVEGRATMSLQLVNLLIENQSYPVQTEVLAFEAESTKKKDATKVGIGAGLGAVIGAIAGGGKGAAIGAAVGVGAGGATVVATRGKELRFEAEHQFGFALQRDVSVKLQ